jgi:uncharacterized membrane protein YphA (DoxX/SURF4 family)
MSWCDAYAKWHTPFLSRSSPQRLNETETVYHIGRSEAMALCPRLRALSKKCELSALGQSCNGVALAIGAHVKFASGSVLMMLAVAAVAIPKAHAANIITFDNIATACGGATLCSFNGTLGYTGTLPFNLSTIGSWFQIDTDGASHLAGQPVEPNGDAGGFLVISVFEVAAPDRGATTFRRTRALRHRPVQAKP